MARRALGKNLAGKRGLAASRACERCGGDLFYDEDDIRCLQCGRSAIPIVPLGLDDKAPTKPRLSTKGRA